MMLPRCVSTISMRTGGTGECPAAIGGAGAQSGLGAIVGCGVGVRGGGARGGSVWQRIGRASKWILIGAAAGAAAGRTEILVGF